MASGKKIYLVYIRMNQRSYADIKTKQEMEMRGIDPRTSRMLSERSTI